MYVENQLEEREGEEKREGPGKGFQGMLSQEETNWECSPVWPTYCQLLHCNIAAE